MNQAERNIYISIRAEQIKESHDKFNKGFFPNGFPLESAIEIADTQLDSDLKNGTLRITIEDLLLETNERCNSIIEERLFDF